MAKAMIGWLYAVDVRHVLPTIRVPTLLLSHTGATRVSPEHGRYISEHVEGAEFPAAVRRRQLRLGRRHGADVA